jgi:hypothetical protein
MEQFYFEDLNDPGIVYFGTEADFHDLHDEHGGYPSRIDINHPAWCRRSEDGQAILVRYVEDGREVEEAWPIRHYRQQW